jgi:hypothetical protein
MNIIESLIDPELFAPHFKGPSWDTWGVFLRGLFALPMSEAELAIYQHHTGRQSAPVAVSTEAALICGRRGGKSRVLALIATFLACSRDYAPYLAPGEVATIAVIAADRRQARAIFRFISGLLEATPLLKPMVEDDTADTITLTNRVVIEIATASFRVTRGYTFAAVLADETAFWRTEDSANPDAEIFRALRPGLSTIPGAILLNASSPYRKAGVLYTTYRRHFGKDDARVLVWKGSTAEMNPLIDPAVIAEAYEDDPESAAAEYGAEFRDDIADFVPRAIIDACTVSGRIELPAEGGCRYRGFCDPSGGSADSMTLAIAHEDKGRVILDAVREVRPPFSPESVVLDFSTLLKSYGLREVYGDRYAGEWVREPFAKYGIGYQQADRPKSDIYRDSLPLLNSKQVELLDLPRLAAQLSSLERRTTRSGKDSIDHAPGGHDDIANAALGAVLLAKTKTFASVSVQPLRY